MKKLQSVAVFCGSTMGKKDSYRKATIALGTLLAEKGITVVYGGGNRGCMGLLAHTVMENGGKVIGVLPKAMAVPDVLNGAADCSLYIEDDMHRRKERMYSLSDGFIALPGGIGTMEEVLEIFTWRQLGYTKGNVALLNVDGFWNPLLSMLDKAVEEGFLEERVRDALITEEDPLRLIERLEEEEKTLPDKLKS